MRIRIAAGALIAGLVLGGCTGSTSEPIGPGNTQSGNGAGAAPPAGTATFFPFFRPTGGGLLPFPIDLYFSPTPGTIPDGTLNLPSSISAVTPHFAALNALDGWSTTADITIRFSTAINASTLAANVRVIRANIDTATKATIGVLGILQPGVDYSIGVSPDIDSAGSTVLIRPLRPLVPSTGPVVAPLASNGYLILVTNGVRSTTGGVAAPDGEYLTVRTAAIADLTAGLTTPTCSSISTGTPAGVTLNGVCRLTFAHLAIGSQLPAPLTVAPTNVVASFSFSTVAARDTLAFIAASTAPRPYTVFSTGLSTAFMGLPGLANIYGGTLNVAYRLAVPATPTSTNVLTTPWQAAGPSPVPGIDAASRHLTRFNPIPAAGTPRDIPLILMVPNIMPKPGAGWPVTVFVHGFPRDRTDALLVADTLASRGFATIAIDMPLHGVTPSSAAYAQPFKQTPIERTFNLDLQINANFGVPGQDGQVDPTGVNFLNLTNVLVQRDNSRQAIADIIALIRTLPTIDFDGVAGADFDPARIHVIGYSLGGTHAGTVLGLLGAEVKASALPSAAAMLTETIKQSATYGPIINNLLAASGLVANTSLYRNFFRNVQAVFDAADTVNYASTMAGAAAGGREVFFSTFEGGGGLPPFPTDPVVPVNATRRLIDTAGGTGVARVTAPGTTNVAGTNGAWVPFSQGIHNSLLDPGPSAAVTFELQSEIADFLASSGDLVIITNPTVIQP